MSDNLKLYNAVRAVPQDAQKEITAGRLKNKTDINPMWRIKTLTEQFGPCGVGWWYTIERQWLETGANGEISAFCNILLYYRNGDTVSQGIPGTGGSAFVARESKGPYTSDECYKMALTDALSVACKALGMGADVYWKADRTKYDQPQQTSSHTPTQPPASAPPPVICVSCHKPIEAVRSPNKSMTAQEVTEFTVRNAGAAMCLKCYNKWKKENG